jgi:hypothetical protein
MPYFDYEAAPFHEWFGLSYSSYLVIPRLALEHMPHDWQRRMIDLLNEASDKHGLQTPSDYEVYRRSKRGHWCGDPWRHYRRGNYDEVLAEFKSETNK